MPPNSILKRHHWRGVFTKANEFGCGRHLTGLVKQTRKRHKTRILVVAWGCSFPRINIAFHGYSCCCCCWSSKSSTPYVLQLTDLLCYWNLVVRGLTFQPSSTWKSYQQPALKVAQQELFFTDMIGQIDRYMYICNVIIIYINKWDIYIYVCVYIYI